jgi:hypothetical protein
MSSHEQGERLEMKHLKQSNGRWFTVRVNADWRLVFERTDDGFRCTELLSREAFGHRDFLRKGKRKGKRG